jgi:hypothetical protein
MDYVVFAQPAHFPWPKSSRDSDRADRAAVIIYEGMAIRVDQTGHYTLRMVAETPATDVDLRLQLIIHRDRASTIADVMKEKIADDAECRHGEDFAMIDPGELGFPGSPEPIGTVTVPTIRFRPSSDPQRPKGADTLFWQVQQEGYSPILHLAANSPERFVLRVERQGSVTMGSAPETPEY